MKNIIIIFVTMISMFAFSFNASAQTAQKKEKKHHACFFYEPQKEYYNADKTLNREKIGNAVAEYKAGKRTRSSIFKTENCQGFTLSVKAGYAVNDGAVGGLAVGYRFAHFMRAEVEANYGQITFEENSYGTINTGLNLYADFFKHKTNGKFSAYVGVGAGYTHFKSFVDIELEESIKRYKLQSNAATIKAMAGVDFRLTYNLHINGGVEYANFGIQKTDVSAEATTNITKHMVTPVVRLTYIF